MVVNKRRKSGRFRAHTTHGYGSMKKNRGAGNRGGRGMAGSGKRADQKKPTILKLYGRSYFGKHGFKNPNSQAFYKRCINLSELDSLVKKEGDSFVVNLVELGYDKLLGRGKVTRKLKIVAPSFSKKALEKVKAVGGEVVESK